jgi:hypothetical protein
MERKQFWIFLGIALLFGLGFEALKTPSNNHVKLAGFGKFRSLLEEGAPIYLPGSSNPRPSAAATQAIEQSETLIDGETDDGALEPTSPAGVSSDPATEAKTDTAEKKDDKAKGDDKKKKKKKKSKVVKGSGEPTEEKPQDKTDSDDKKKSASADTSDDSYGPMGGSTVSFRRVNPDAIPRSVKEWEDFLFKDPSIEKTERLVKYHQTGITSAEIFYEVVKRMLEDSDQMKELGVRALGSVHSNRSFVFLVAVDRADFVMSRHKRQARMYLHSYTRLENLRHLASVLGSTESGTTPALEAIRLLRVSGDMHLRNLNPEPFSDGSEPGENRGPAASDVVLRYFNPMITTLEYAQNKWQDDNVRQAAAQTLSALQSLIDKK